MSRIVQPFSNKAFRADAISLFAKTEGGHTSRWTYNGKERGAHLDSGADLWLQFSRAARNYYLASHDTAVVAHSLSHLGRKFREADTFVDLGSANGSKAMPIFQFCEGMKIYVPVDQSEDLLAKAEETVRKRAPDRKVHPIHGDFYTGRLAKTGKEITLPGSRHAGVMLGSTISNMNMTLEQEFPYADIVQKIKRLGAFLKNEDLTPTPLAISYDSNQDLTGDALKAYNNIHWKRMIVGLMADVQHILRPEGTFNAFAWHHEARPDPNKFVIHQCVVATRAQDFMIKDTDNKPHEFSVKKGDAFVVVNNIKYPVDLMLALIKAAGHEPDDPIRIPDNHMVLQTMDAHP